MTDQTQTATATQIAAAEQQAFRANQAEVKRMNAEYHQTQRQMAKEARQELADLTWDYRI